MKKTNKENKNEKKNKIHKTNNKRNNKTNIDYNELFLSYEENNIDNEKAKDYDENKSLIFI
jgi:hypothetical protein